MEVYFSRHSNGPRKRGDGATKKTIKRVKRGVTNDPIQRHIYCGGSALTIGMTFHRPFKLTFKNKTPGFELEMAKLKDPKLTSSH